MTTVHVRANQTTVDWAEGADMVVERTPFVDKLITNGGLTDLDAFKTDPSQPYVTYRDEEAVVDAPMAVLEVDDDPDVNQIPKPPRARRKTT
ncbi:hypothetical protein [Rhodococcus sp. IEGM 1379]|uniref:hypothetical protein n=1 Tax=Rhodococcus sp. IEGM 1379 TaxID=3047086 RepID=UPI0024B7C750|nr:hypothetical protein [Rhodococcus sp. IEGM 1379]MDI9914348.1 hypothetical protein [Rhodococcus sp. IEGM 1379]